MGHELVVEQDVPAEPERVFSAWTSADALRAWWWPHIPDTSYEVDARVGGHYGIWSEAAGIGVRGEFLDLDPPRAIRMTWCWLDGGVDVVEEQVRVTFARHLDGTQVRLEHECLDVPGHAENLRLGWEDVLARLAKTAT